MWLLISQNHQVCLRFFRLPTLMSDLLTINCLETSFEVELHIYTYPVPSPHSLNPWSTILLPRLAEEQSHPHHLFCYCPVTCLQGKGAPLL